MPPIRKDTHTAAPAIVPPRQTGKDACADHRADPEEDRPAQGHRLLFTSCFVAYLCVVHLAMFTLLSLRALGAVNRAQRKVEIQRN